MSEPTNNDRAFDLIEQEARIARTARMLNENQRLQANQRKDIAERVLRFIEERGLTQAAYAKGDPTITVEHLEDVDNLTMGHEDAERLAEAVSESSGIRRVV